MAATDEQRSRVRDAIADLEYQGRKRAAAAYAAVLADSERLAALRAVERLRQETECEDIAEAETPADPRTLDLIAWSLRLPLLRDARAKRSVLPGAQTGPPEPESARLDTLITEGERALGLLPPEVGDE